jgi:hypothetical protein
MGSVKQESAQQDDKESAKHDKYCYIRGGDPNLQHKRVLGSGGFGSVHEVKRLS